MTSFLRRVLIEGDVDELATQWSPVVAGAIFGVAVSLLADASAVAGIKPPFIYLVAPLVSLFALLLLAALPRRYLASLDDGGGGGGVFGDYSEGGLSASARAKVLLFVAWVAAFGSAAGGVALAVNVADDKRSRVAQGSLASTVLTLVAAMIIWFFRGSGDDYYSGYYGY